MREFGVIVVAKNICEAAGSGTKGVNMGMRVNENDTV